MSGTRDAPLSRDPITLVAVLTRTERFLRERGLDTPRLDTELLLCHVLGLKRLQLYLQYDRPMQPAELDILRPLVARRGKREPLAWIVGSAGFHAVELAVGPGVLVPRPDTEALVDAALSWFAPAGETPLYVADVGTGTGAIAIALATARPDLRVYATDISPDALAIARRNVAEHQLTTRVAVLEGSLLSPIPEARPIDWVISNPPYIPHDTIDGLMPEVSRWEPRLALDGGPDGLNVYRELIPAAARRARAGVLVEVGQGQHGPVYDLMRRAGLTDVQTWPDLAGVTRVVGGRRATPPSSSI